MLQVRGIFLWVDARKFMRVLNDGQLTAQSCLERGSLREEQRGADKLDVVALQDSGRATRRVIHAIDATNITLRESRINWETHGGRKTHAQNVWWKERSRQACRLCRPTNPIVDLRSLVLKNSHSQRNVFTPKYDYRNKIKLEEHIETQRTALSSLPTKTVQARKTALDKRPAQTRKLRTKREWRWVARRALRDVGSAHLILLQTGRDEERERTEGGQCQRGMGYGATQEWIRVFDVLDDGERVCSYAGLASARAGEDGVDRERKRRWGRKLRTGTTSTRTGGGDADCSFVRAGAVMSGWCTKRMTPESPRSGGVSQRSFRRR
ncbi:hypothetical protein DFH08DRAFT_812247 [Mycena albidolilacea]|uniref:Uncharacterized protein n=1 Tax=Mycena albidolilacea TaxID=1033008 RepID=A0AAD6ZU77_9AGAR|nr:hypothetical protein DFH08DRAFT_812247 [Mycena albidolilacea]